MYSFLLMQLLPLKLFPLLWAIPFFCMRLVCTLPLFVRISKGGLESFNTLVLFRRRRWRRHWMRDMNYSKVPILASSPSNLVKTTQTRNLYLRTPRQFEATTLQIYLECQTFQLVEGCLLQVCTQFHHRSPMEAMGVNFFFALERLLLRSRSLSNLSTDAGNSGHVDGASSI